MESRVIVYLEDRNIKSGDYGSVLINGKSVIKIINDVFERTSEKHNAVLANKIS